MTFYSADLIVQLHFRALWMVCCMALTMLYCNLPYTCSSCAYLNLDGLGYPLDHCLVSESISTSASFEYTCTTASNTDTVVYQHIYENSKCSGTPALKSVLTNYTSVKCSGKGSDCGGSTATVLMSAYDYDNVTKKCTDDKDDGYFKITAVTNQCLIDGTGNAVIYKCKSKNAITVQQYSDTKCKTLLAKHDLHFYCGELLECDESGLYLGVFTLFELIGLIAGVVVLIGLLVLVLYCVFRKQKTSEDAKLKELETAQANEFGDGISKQQHTKMIEMYHNYDQDIGLDDA